MPRKGGNPLTTSIVMGDEAKSYLNRLCMALQHIAKVDFVPSRSWLIAECVRFSYCHTPLFLSAYMQGESHESGKSMDKLQGATDGAVSQPLETAGKEASGGTGADSVCSMREADPVGDGPRAPNRSKRARPRIRKTLP